MFGAGDQPAGQAVPGSGLNLSAGGQWDGGTNESGPRTGSGETRSGSQPGRRDAGLTRRSDQSERQNESPPPGGWRLEAGSAGAEDDKSVQVNFTASSAANKPDGQQNGQYGFNDPY